MIGKKKKKEAITQQTNNLIANIASGIFFLLDLLKRRNIDNICNQNILRKEKQHLIYIKSDT